MSLTLYLALIFAGLGIYLYPFLTRWITITGIGKTIPQLNTKNCQVKYPEKFQGCEDIRPFKAHSKQFLFLACSHDIMQRKRWFPPLGHLDKDIPGTIRDSFFIYDIEHDSATKLEVENLPPDADLVLHGIDIIQPTSNELIIFSVNHRRTGSVIERFKHILGSKIMKHEKTFDGNKSGYLFTPNSVTVVDHMTNSFYSSNDHRHKQGLIREVETLGQRPWGHIAFHSDRTGFRIAYRDLVYPNGIIAQEDKLYLSTCTGGSVSVFKIHSNYSLTLIEDIKLDFILDNLSLTPDGDHLLTAGHPLAFAFTAHAKNPELIAPSMTAKISIEKKEPRYEIIFSDYTGLMNGSTSAVQVNIDNRNIFFTTGVLSRGLLRCENQ